MLDGQEPIEFVQPSDRQEDEEGHAPKREFLKRKRPVYVPPKQTQQKQYKYYTEAFDQA